ncbi:MAG: ribosome maturation factor RimP [Christensenellales bacterium]
MSKIADMVEELVKPFADSLGLEIVEVEYGKKVNGNNLTIFIDKQGGVTIDDCEALHKLIDAPLDELDPTNGASYVLNVSSCGIDRPLKNLKDYLRNKGKLVEVKLYQPYNGCKKYEGVIIDASEQGLTIKDNNGNEINLSTNLIATVLPVVEI